MIFKCNYRIGIEDIDNNNEMNNKAVLKMLENAGGRHSESVGYGLNTMYITGLSWVLLAWKVKIIKRAKYDSLVEIRTWARNSNKVFTYRDYEIYDENGELLVIATSKWTLIDIYNGTIAGLSKDVIEKYGDEEKSVFEERNIEKLIEPKTEISKINYNILRSDIDMNNHVHNLCYLDFAYEVLPEKIYRSEECKNIEIMYKRQIKFGDEIVCKYTLENEKNIVTIKSKDGNTLHSIVKLY